MKFINEAVSVQAQNRMPCRIRWEDRIYRTRKVIDYWVLQTRWWGREEKRIYFRLETDRGIVEVYRAAESSAPGVRGAGRSDGEKGSAASHPPLPVEGDTHTRERRRTDAVYRPDVQIAETARRTAVRRAVPVSSAPRVRWILSKILD